MAYINLDAKSDRELLLIVAGNCNSMKDDIGEVKDHLEKLNGSVQENTRGIARNRNDIVTLQSGKGPQNWRDNLKGHWPTLSVIATLAALIIIELVNRVPWP